MFRFENYDFDDTTGEATFRYSIDGTRHFQEVVRLQLSDSVYNHDVFDCTLTLAHVLIGISYYKTFPSREVSFATGVIDSWQADFLNHVYQEGLGQYAAENGLTRDDLAHFIANIETVPGAVAYEGEGVLSLQSGGKDSLLTASLLQKQGTDFASMYVSSTDTYPAVVDSVGVPVRNVRRSIDRDALAAATNDGALNGHIPVTYVVMSIALLQAILDGKKTVLTSIGHEGEEPREWIGDLPVNHQWSKTWEAEQLFSEYVRRYISPDLQIGSSLRRFSELRIAELFAETAWERYGHVFSSCNVANYMQGANNQSLGWCGECPKCANSFLLFAPFIQPDDQKSLFGGQDLFEKPFLTETFKGLLAIDGVPKPFECVGETDELRYAYGRRLEGYGSLPFEVPTAEFDYKAEYPLQEWARELIL